MGNTRIVIADSDNNGLADVMQETHYYPFGMAQEGMSYRGLLSGAEANKYLYNGKEMQVDFGLDWYDYGARFYDAQIGRWHAIDPMQEKHYDYTGYAYVYNNPMILIDPLGLDSIKIHVLASQNKKLSSTINNAVKQMNAAYAELNVDLHVSWNYIESKDDIMSKDDFYSRDGAEENDSYVVMSYGDNVEGVAEDMNNKGWEKIGVSKSTNGTSAENDFAAIVNLSNALQPINSGNVYDSPAQKLSITTQHETGHPKFIGHPRADNYDVLNKRPGTKPSHVDYTIMDSNVRKTGKHDRWMNTRLKKLHGVQKCVCKMPPH